MLDETTICLRCGAPLKYLAKNARRNRGYCRRECYLAKPPRLAYAEREWGKPATVLLSELLNRHTIEATAQLLGVNRQALYHWLDILRIRRVTRWEVV